MSIATSPIAGQKVLLRRESSGQFRPNLPEPTTPQEAKLYKETFELAGKAENFLGNHLAKFAELRKQDNREQDLNSAPGIVATSERVFESSLDRLTKSSVLRFNPESQEILSFQDQANGQVSRPAGRNYTEMLDQTASVTYTASPMLLSHDHRVAVAEDPRRSAHYQESLREIGDGIFEYFLATEEQLRPRDLQY